MAADEVVRLVEGGEPDVVENLIVVEHEKTIFDAAETPSLQFTETHF